VESCTTTTVLVGGTGYYFFVSLVRETFYSLSGFPGTILEDVEDVASLQCSDSWGYIVSAYMYTAASGVGPLVGMAQRGCMFVQESLGGAQRGFAP